MIDFHSFCSILKVTWIKHLLTNDNANWKVIPRYIYLIVSRNFSFFYMNFQTFKHLPIHLSSLPSFYQDVTKAWVL